jgi:hypothetical protein
MMSEQTSAAQKVRIPGQAVGQQGYRPRHRAAKASRQPAAPQASAAPASAVPAPAVLAEQPSAQSPPAPAIVPPAGFLASERKAQRDAQRQAQREAQREARGSAPGTAGTSSARAAAPLRSVVTPVAPEVPHQVRRHYDTPVWVPEGRTGEQDERYLALVADDAAADSSGRPEGMIRQARWTSSRSASVAAALLLIGFLAEAAASASGLLRRQSTPALALTLGCLLGAAGVYALLVVLRPVVVELAEPWLSVHRGDRHDRFNLSSPFQEVRVSGRPGTRKWLLVLTRPGGGVVRVRHGMVDSRSLDVVVRYAQALSDREREAREERFNL